MAEGVDEGKRPASDDEQKREASSESERLRRDVAEPPKSNEYGGGYRLTSDLFASLVSLLVGLAWPTTALLLVYLLVHNAGKFEDAVNRFMQNKQSAEVSAGPTGLLIKIVQREVQEGLSQQIKTQPGSVNGQV